MSTIEGSFYLCVSKRDHYSRSGQLCFRVTADNPALKPGEIAIHVNAQLPAMLFKRPVLKASIAIPGDGVIPAEVTAEVASNIAETIRQNLGIEMKITVGEPNAQ